MISFNIQFQTVPEPKSPLYPCVRPNRLGRNQMDRHDRRHFRTLHQSARRHVPASTSPLRHVVRWYYLQTSPFDQHPNQNTTAGNRFGWSACRTDGAAFRSRTADRHDVHRHPDGLHNGGHLCARSALSSGWIEAARDDGRARYRLAAVQSTANG